MMCRTTVTISLFLACLLAEVVDAAVSQSLPAQQFVQIPIIQRPMVREEKEQQQKAALFQEQQQKGGELEEKAVPPSPADLRSPEVPVVAAASSPAIEATAPVVVTASDAEPDAASDETALTQAKQAAAFTEPAQKFVEANSDVPSAQAQDLQVQLEEQLAATRETVTQPAEQNRLDSSAKTSLALVSASAASSAASGQSAPIDSSASAAGTAGQTEYPVFTPSQPQVAQAASSVATGSSASSARSQTEPQAGAQSQPQSPPVVTSDLPLGVIQATIQDVPPQTEASSQAQTVTFVTASLSPITLQVAAAADPKAQARLPDAQEQPQAQTAGSSTTQAVAGEAAATDAKTQAQARPVQGQLQSRTAKAAQVQAASTDGTPQSPVQSAQAAPQTVTVVTASESAPMLVFGAEAAKQLTQELATHPNTRVVVAVATQVVPAEEAAPIAPIAVSPQDTPIVATSTGYSAMFAALLQSASFALFVKAACMISNVIFQVSPLPQVQQWVSQACTGEADSAPFVAIAFGGWQWCFYGVFAWLITQRSGFLILVHSNCLGALLGTYYTIAFKRHCKSQSSMRGFWGYLRVAAVLAATQFAAMLLLPIDRSLFLSGIIASLCSVASAASVLVTLPTVIKTGRSDSIPGAVVWAGLASAVIWFYCGIMLADPCILIPNGFAMVTGVACVMLKIKFPSGDVVKDTAKFHALQDKMLSKPSVHSSGEKARGEAAGSSEETPAELKPAELTPARRLSGDGTGGTC